MHREHANGGASIGLLSLGAILVSVAFFTGVLLRYQLRNQFAVERDAKIAGLTRYAMLDDETALLHPDPKHVAQILLTSRALGVYDYLAIARTIRQPVNVHGTLPNANSAIAHSIDGIDASHIYGWAFLPTVSAAGSRTSILLRSIDSVIKLDATATKRIDVSQHYGPRFMFDFSGFDLYLGAYAIPSGEYQVGILVQNGRLVGVNWEDAHIRIPSAP
jgi:hypothetical protein